MGLNYASEISARRYYVTHKIMPPVSPNFRTDDVPDKPAEPDFPDGLTSDEQTEVLAWRNGYGGQPIDRNGNPGPAPTLAAAIAKVAEFQTYFESLEYLAWRDANEIYRWAAWQWFCADALDAAEAIVPLSQVTDMADKVSAPAGPVPRSAN